MKSNMCVNVEFLAGTDITQAIEEAKQKARQWNVAYVRFDFNETKFSIGQNALVLRAGERYRADHNLKYIVENGD